MAKQINFDLGQANDGPCCAPSCCSSDKQVYYPSFYVSGDKKLEVPDEGVMTVRYKKVSSSQSEDKRGEHYSCCIEVREIVSTESEKAEAPAKRSRDAEDALDSLMAEKQKKESY
jgi:hypothetical protein